MKTIVITGGNAGLGLETAKALANDKNNRLLLGCRNQAKARKAIETIKRLTGNPHVQSLELDLGSFASIHKFADQVIRIVPTIDALDCNAGVQIPAGTQTTQEGIEATFGINVLGHFLLTKRLLPHLNPGTGRIVLVSSGTHFKPAIWQSALFGIPPGDYPGWQVLSSPDSFSNYAESRRGLVRYSTSKLCMILFGYELNRQLRVQQSRITVNSFDPGLMPGTELAREGSAIQIWAWNNILPAMRIFNGINSIETSGSNMSKLLTDSRFNGVTGKYFEETKETRSSIDSYDTARWADLWAGCERLSNKERGV